MGKLILAIALFMSDAALLILIVVSAATGWRFSLLGPAILTPPEPPPNIASEEIAKSSPGESANAGNDISESQNSQASDSANEQGQTPPGESATSSSAEAQAASPDERATADNEQDPNASKYPPASSMTTSANATENDIKNYSWENGWSTMSPQAERMHSFDAVTGGWRAVMVTDPLELLDCYSTDNMNVDISGSPDSATITFNSNKRRFHYNGEVLNLSGEHPSFSGSFKEDYIYAASMEGSVKLYNFYIDGDTEYALGLYTFPSGEKGYIGMVRP
ncbi:MAG: hypothetical protein K6G50_02610 [bacterium]|nr:hypothetical protein [bacterium]